MRRFILILMIALLPLRSWVGEAMAMDMQLQHPLAMQNIAASADKSSASAAFNAEMPMTHTDCPGHAEAAKSASDSSPSHCGTCPLCQMCHSAAAPAPSVVPPAAWLRHALPFAGQTRFASAAAAFALKPPIS
ncbi:hypothetical protein [Rhodoferax sp.]|uniref:hypothetical protein n=1 Tax=Rhodoferax sp. TaxID=50421 RepID=UPI00374D8223